MSVTNWNKVKEHVYYWDEWESWRDIYILQTSKEDWINWIDLVNQKYHVEFYNGLTQQTESAIDKNTVFNYQEHKSDLMSSAVIKVGRINVNCRMFSSPEIENDIDPREVQAAEDHETLMEYLKSVSKTLGKPVLLTGENKPDLVYVTVENDEVRISLH